MARALLLLCLLCCPSAYSLLPSLRPHGGARRSKVFSEAEDASKSEAARVDVDLLSQAVGIGRGKHFSGQSKASKRKKRSKSEAPKRLDPFEEALQRQAESKVAQARDSRAREGLFLQRRDQRMQEIVKAAEEARGEMMSELEEENVDEDAPHSDSGLGVAGVTRPSAFPRETTVDPYDPSTFGYIYVGYVMGAHGIQGHVRIRVDSDFASDRVCKKGVRHLKDPSRRMPRAVLLEGGKLQRDDVYIVKLSGVRNRNDAARLQGWSLYVLEEVAREPGALDADDEYFVEDLVGLRVLHVKTGEYVGSVAGVVASEDVCTVSVEGLGNDLLELELPPLKNYANSPVTADAYKSGFGWRERRLLVPFVNAIVPDVRISEGVIYIDPPEGLLEMAAEVDEKVIVKGLLPAEGMQNTESDW